MLKLTSGFLNEIKYSLKLDVPLVDRLSLINQSEDEDFRVDNNEILKIHNRVCVPDASQFVYACLTCQKLNIEHQKSFGLMQ